MDEAGLADKLLALNRQTLKPRAVVVCVNQPEAYYHDGEAGHLRICACNKAVFEQVAEFQKQGKFGFEVVLIDCFSPGKAWDEKHIGVGWARRTALDVAAELAETAAPRLAENFVPLLVCMDADTLYPDSYLQDLQRQFEAHPQAVAIANPYYHDLPADLPEKHAAALLHYECYMRAYALQMMRTEHPYAFTAVGSSMACTLTAYRRIGGISPVKSGEDFYFLQKLRKTGALLRHSESVSHPSCRLSTRVFFGTGPALNKGLENNWVSYPFYPLSLFRKMQDAYRALPRLFESGMPDPALDFWEEAFGRDWWKKMRANAGGRPQQFIRTCLEKFDALRSLQFLKSSYAQNPESDWENLSELCDNFIGTHWKDRNLHSLSALALSDWKTLRHDLFLCERHLQQNQALLPAF
ncbi:MAG: glycosyltransferase family 2 protein [Bacteroidales bacterium]|nr:glycosyltransferase family 2 protein [Bacteroidales bacterium]